MNPVTIPSRNAYELARIADVPSPDTLDSPGALFLLSVQDDVMEAAGTWETLSEDDAQETAQRLADDAVETLESRGTYGKWLAFADLCAWQEDVSDYLPELRDMNQGADVALYIIAERLALALLTGDES